MFVSLPTYTFAYNRRRKFKGLTVSDGTDRDALSRRVFFLFFGTQSDGGKTGNTVSGTWQVLQILQAAMLDVEYKDGGWKDAMQESFSYACMSSRKYIHANENHVSYTLFANTCIRTLVQFLRNRRGGLPAFRRLVGRPILRDVRLQDVVFAGGQDVWVHSHTGGRRSVKAVCLQADMVRALTHKRQPIGHQSAS